MESGRGRWAGRKAVCRVPISYIDLFGTLHGKGTSQRAGELAIRKDYPRGFKAWRWGAKSKLVER